MADNTNVGDTNLQGASENQSGVSQAQAQPIAGSPQGSQELLELKKGFDLLRKELGGLQSRQDKEQNEVQRFMDDVKKQMASGKSFEEAERTVTENRKAQEKDDLLFKIAQKVGVLGESSQTQSAGNGANVTNSATQDIARKYNLDTNDKDIADAVASGDMLKLFEVAMSKKTNLPSLSDAPPMTGGIPRGVDTAALSAEMEQLIKQPSRNAKRIQEIGKLLKEAG